MPVAEAKRLVDDDPAFERLVGLDIIRIDDESADGQAVVVRPKLIEVFNELHQYGVAIDKLIDLHEQISPLLDQVSAILVQAGVEEVFDKVNPGAAMPDDVEVAELITTLVRFRTQAVQAAAATLAFSIESTIESVVAQLLGDFVEQKAESGNQ